MFTENTSRFLSARGTFRVGVSSSYRIRNSHEALNDHFFPELYRPALLLYTHLNQGKSHVCQRAPRSCLPDEFVYPCSLPPLVVAQMVMDIKFGDQMTGDISVATENILKMVESGTAKAAVGVAQSAVYIFGGIVGGYLLYKAIKEVYGPRQSNTTTSTMLTSDPTKVGARTPTTLPRRLPTGSTDTSEAQFGGRVRHGLYVRCVTLAFRTQTAFLGRHHCAPPSLAVVLAGTG